MPTIIIDRFDGKNSFEQSYKLDPADVAGKTVLNTLLFIKQTQDPTLNFTASCRCAICGACAVRVNGHAVLACDTKMDDLAKTYGSDPFHISPLANFKVISDLVVDWEPAMSRRAVLMASSPSIWIISSKSARSRMAGTKSAPIP